MAGRTVRLFAYIIGCTITLYGCHRPSLMHTETEHASTIFTECVNYERQSFLDVELALPLGLNQEKSLRGLSNSTLLNVDDEIILTTKNGFLHIISSSNIDDDQNTKISPAISVPPTRYGRFLFIASELGVQGLKAYDLEKGKIVWALDDYVSKSSPIADKNLVFHAGLNGRILGLNIPSGEVIWETDMDDKIVSSLAYQDGYLVAVSQNGTVSTLDATSGSKLWTIDLADAFYTHPVINGKKIYLTSYNGVFFTVNLLSGMIENEMAFPAPFYYSPTADGDIVFLPRSDGKIEAISAKTHQILWSTALEGPSSAGLLVTSDFLFCSTGQKKLYVMNKHNGKIKQQIDLDGRARSIPLIIRNHLFLSYERDELAVFAPSEDTL